METQRKTIGENEFSVRRLSPRKQLRLGIRLVKILSSGLKGLAGLKSVKSIKDLTDEDEMKALGALSTLMKENSEDDMMDLLDDLLKCASISVGNGKSKEVSMDLDFAKSENPLGDIMKVAVFVLQTNFTGVLSKLGN